MRRCLLAIAQLALLVWIAGMTFASPVHAVPVAFNFSAEVYDVTRGTIADPFVTGTIRYNTEAAQDGLILSPNSPVETWHEYLFDHAATMQATVDRRTYVLPINYIAVINNYHPVIDIDYNLDRFFVSTPFDRNGEWMQLWIDSGPYPASPSSLITSTALLTSPPDLRLADQLNPQPFIFYYDDLRFSARLTSITNAIPEPHGLCLVVTVLGAVLWSRRMA